jgi:hypothetical protein
MATTPARGRKNKILSFVLIVVLAIVVLLLKRCNNPVDRTTSSKTNRVAQGRGLNRDISVLFYSKHARCRMECRQISRDEVESILQHGAINYRKSNLQVAAPSYAVEGITADGQQVRIVFAPKKTQTTVVTVIDLQNEWDCPSCN